jgi:hypothetical protein
MPGFTDFLSRLQTDHSFYLQFRQNSEEALAHYELSLEERAVLTGPCLQLWNEIGRRMSRDEGIGGTMDGATSGTPRRTNHTTQTWRLSIGQSDSAESQFDHQVALGRLEVQRAVAKVRAAGAHAERLAAVSILMEHIG